MSDCANCGQCMSKRTQATVCKLCRRFNAMIFDMLDKALMKRFVELADGVSPALRTGRGA